jgi:ornithine carbamoyltransferase
MTKDFVSLAAFSKEDIWQILHLARWLKEDKPAGFRPLAGKTAAMIFEKPSLRTHVSFEVGILQLGGQSIFLSDRNIGLDSRESVRDAAEVISRYNDLIVARTFSHRTVEDLARYASIPVVNALTDLLHPCQILADVYTMWERGLMDGLPRVAFIGDGNNVANSWLEVAEKLPVHFVLACPGGYEPDRNLLQRARHAGVSHIEILHDPVLAATDADVLYTDVWTSMGQEEERAQRIAAFKGYQINQQLLDVAAADCIVMHCLPAHRGEEITADVLEGPHSAVLDEAENRLHVQKAILAFLFGAQRPIEAGVSSSIEALVT